MEGVSATFSLTADGQLPLLLAISDNGPQMRSHSTREFLAGVAIAQQFGRPHITDRSMTAQPEPCPQFDPQDRIIPIWTW